MCTLVKPCDQSKIIDRPLTVYKVVIYFDDNFYMTPYVGANAELGKLYKSDITYSRTITVWDSASLPGEDKAYSNATGLKSCKEVIRGFHSFLTLSACKKFMPSDVSPNFDVIRILRAEIPAGSQVVYGYMDNIVSNQILYKDEVSRNS